MRLAELIDSFIDYLRSQKGYSDHTVKNYQVDLDHFLKFLANREESAGKKEIAPELESIDFLVV